MGATAPPPSLPLTAGTRWGPSLPGRAPVRAGKPRGSLTRPGAAPIAVSRAAGRPPSRAQMRAGRQRMANGDSEVGVDPAGGFVQLLTPDGERVDSVTTADGTTYSVDFTDDEYRELYRDLVTVRRLDAEATALQRQGELGIWASLLGQEAAQVGSGRALRPQDMAFPDLPRARRAVLPRDRPDHAVRPVPRRRPGRLGPEQVQVQHLHDRHRRADTARHRLRHGHHHGRQDRQRRRGGGHRLLR